MAKNNRIAMVMAGGTGGHIIPGLTVAKALKAEGWDIVWLGNPDAMEGKLVPSAGINMAPLKFVGVRGKGLVRLLMLPVLLTKAWWQAGQHIRHYQPNLVIGMGGYVSFPGGIMARLMGKPLVLHEQNSIPGLTNKVLAKFANRVLTAFPNVLNGHYVGNPVRNELTEFVTPHLRLTGRSGPLRILVVGGSLGAQALNEVVPKALALLPTELRPSMTHQAGEKHSASLKANYDASGVEANCVSFIDDMAQAYYDADLVICRSGAMTVSEVAATGTAALFIPYPHAVDDHQTANANYLTQDHAAWRQTQSEFTPEWLAQWLSQRSREELLDVATRAYARGQRDATASIVTICKELAG